MLKRCHMGFGTAHSRSLTPCATDVAASCGRERCVPGEALALSGCSVLTFDMCAQDTDAVWSSYVYGSAKALTTASHLIFVHVHVQPAAQFCRLCRLCDATAVCEEADRQPWRLACALAVRQVPHFSYNFARETGVQAISSSYASIAAAVTAASVGMHPSPPGWYSFASARRAAGSTVPPRISTPSMSNTNAGGPSGLAAALLRRRQPCSAAAAAEFIANPSAAAVQNCRAACEPIIFHIRSTEAKLASLSAATAVAARRLMRQASPAAHLS